jgi:hypothetical protein
MCLVLLLILLADADAPGFHFDRRTHATKWRSVFWGQQKPHGVEAPQTAFNDANSFKETILLLIATLTALCSGQ